MRKYTDLFQSWIVERACEAVHGKYESLGPKDGNCREVGLVGHGHNTDRCSAPPSRVSTKAGPWDLVAIGRNKYWCTGIVIPSDEVRRVDCRLGKFTVQTTVSLHRSSAKCIDEIGAPPAISILQADKVIDGDVRQCRGDGVLVLSCVSNGVKEGR